MASWARGNSYGVAILSVVAAPRIQSIAATTAVTVQAFGQGDVAIPLTFGGSKSAHDNARALAVFNVLATAAGNDPTQVSTAQTPNGRISCQTSTLSDGTLSATCLIASVISFEAGATSCDD